MKNTNVHGQPNGNEGEKKKRYVVVILLITAIFGIYVLRLFQWQIVDGEKYAKDALNQDTDLVKVDATRGEILDKDGNILAGNKITYSIEFNALTMDKDRNPALFKILSILDERGEEWIDNLPILIDEEGNYYFDEERQGEIDYMKSSAMLDVQEYATADNCMDALIGRFNCAGYSKVDTRNLISVRYSMFKQGFSITEPYVIADDVSPDTMGIFNQLKSEIPGVETNIIVSRNYGEDGTLAPHIVGTIGAITAEQYEKIQENDNEYSWENISGYALNDRMGQSGIESAYESYLRGKNGRKTMVSGGDSETTTRVEEAPEPGNSVYLTIDSELQKVANASLKENILSNTEHADATTGAVVAIDTKTFGILASSTYPSFDISEYYERPEYYNELMEDSEKPMFNRAFDGVYAPGSVFKPFVAITALEEGIISDGTTVFCEKVYKYYDDVQPTCLGYHDYVNVYGAIAHSCNVFFFDTGRRLGIDKMDAYAPYFALGEKTGVEIGESKGQMSTPEYYEQVSGQRWMEGATMYAAIGQQDDQFTPLQLATYAATIANDGVRYKTHLMDKITDYTGEEVIEEYQPEIVSDAEVSQSVMDTVKYGMRLTATEGSAVDVFGNYPVAVACKTGTAETYDGSDNLTFIIYAPYDDPEIAVAVVMAHGGKGAFARNVAKDILDQYFGYDEEGKKVEETPEPEGEKYVNGREVSPGAFYDVDKDAPKSSKPDTENNPEDGSPTSSEPYTGEDDDGDGNGSNEDDDNGDTGDIGEA